MKASRVYMVGRCGAGSVIVAVAMKGERENERKKIVKARPNSLYGVMNERLSICYEGGKKTKERISKQRLYH